ncbi:lamin tail domain-containing protein (plasmid) [Nonomuraea sp. CA-143628]|uniref:lamin tail domain-containing protein n=1 Tax=Nonomuraea sp. CA-143628 TaxID=3239997 RepID=UPI003D89D83C
MRPAPLLVSATLASFAVLSPPAYAATPAVQIVKVYYDSPGKDTRSSSSLNAEYASLKNTTGKAIQLERWILRDASGHKYRFGSFLLKPGKTVTVRTGSGNDGPSTVYWGSGNYVWNNSPGGDTAGIYRGSDLKKIDTCSWGRSSKAYTTC